jgi:hypothetical protein
LDLTVSPPLPRRKIKDGLGRGGRAFLDKRKGFLFKTSFILLKLGVEYTESYINL